MNKNRIIIVLFSVVFLFSVNNSAMAAGKQYLSPFLSFEGLFPVSVAQFGTGDFSMGFWFQNPERCPNYFVINVQDPGQSKYVVVGWPQGQEVLQAIMHSGSTTITAQTDYTLSSTPHLLFLTCDRSETDGLKLWLDGVVVATENPTSLASIDFSPSSETGIVHINSGAIQSGFDPGDQLFDDVQIYTGKAFTPAEMATIWNNGKGTEVNETTFASIVSNGAYCNFNGNNFYTYSTGAVSFIEGENIINGVGTSWTESMNHGTIYIPSIDKKYLILFAMPNNPPYQEGDAILIGNDEVLPSSGSEVSYVITAIGLNIPMRKLINGVWSDENLVFADYIGRDFSVGGVPFTPTTTAIATAGGNPYTFDNWSTSLPILVTLSCDDVSGPGCGTTYYCSDTDNSCTPTTVYSSAVSVSTAGTSYIRFYSTDMNGASEAINSSTIKIYPTPSANVDISSIDNRSNNCFIATATYGTPMAEEVRVLKQFRNEYLLTNPIGEVFVNTYYKMSPHIADFIRVHTILKKPVRFILNPLIWVSRKITEARY